MFGVRGADGGIGVEAGKLPPTYLSLQFSKDMYGADEVPKLYGTSETAYNRSGRKGVGNVDFFFFPCSCIGPPCISFS